MSHSQKKTVICIRCGARWTIDLAQLSREEGLLYKGDKQLRIETFRLRCPNCDTINMLEVTFEEKPHA